MNKIQILPVPVIYCLPFTIDWILIWVWAICFILFISMTSFHGVDGGTQNIIYSAKILLWSLRIIHQKPAINGKNNIRKIILLAFFSYANIEIEIHVAFKEKAFILNNNAIYFCSCFSFRFTLKANELSYIKMQHKVLLQCA